jgi:hypothetical protein
MTPSPDLRLDPPLDRIVAAAEAVAAERPDVDLEMARELLTEAATMLHNGLALEGLDAHDAEAVVAGLCVDLVSDDPGASIRARSEATLRQPGDLHEPEAVAASLLISAGILRL